MIYVFTCGLTLIANSPPRPLADRHDRETSLAVTLASGFDYVFRVTRPLRSADVGNTNANQSGAAG